MEQKKIEHITLHLIVFRTIVIIGVLARQTVLHYGWDEFSSYLILIICSIVMSAIYFNLQMILGQIFSPTIEKYFMRFKCYRNKAIVVEVPVIHHKLIKSSKETESAISESEPKIETTSDTTEKVSTPSCSESNKDTTELPKEETTPFSTNNISIEEPKQPSEYEVLRATVMAEKERASQEKLNKVLAYMKRTLVTYLNESDLNRLCGYITDYYLSDFIIQS